MLPSQAAAETPNRNIFRSGSATITIAEDAGASIATRFRVQATGAIGTNLTADLTVNYTMGGTATAGTDYTLSAVSGGTQDYSAGTGTFVIPSGTMTWTTVDVLTVTPTADNVQDSGETIILTLVAGAGYGVTTDTSRTYKLVEDGGPASFELSGDPLVGETLTVNRVADDPDGNGTVADHFWHKRDPGGEWSPVLISGGMAVLNNVDQYVVRAGDVGKELRAQVDYTDDLGITRPVFTPPVGPVTDGPVEPNPCVSAQLLAHVDARIASAATNRWVRIKNALNRSANAITLSEVREIHDRRQRYGWSLNRLDEVIAALECMVDSTPDAPMVSITGGDAITEGGTARFTLTATPPPTSDITVVVRVKNLNIGITNDENPTRTVTIGTSGTATLDIATRDDSNDWPDGTVYVAVQRGIGYQAATGYQVADAPNGAASVRVADNEVTPGMATLSVGDATHSERSRNCVGGYMSCMNFTVTLSRTPKPGERVLVFYQTQQTAPVSAKGTGHDRDFYHAQGTVKFSSGGPLTQQVQVLLADDNRNEGTERFELKLSYPVGAAITDDTGTGTITD
ncbi:Calx-beta domain-containing protein [Candidatus Poriferisodalis sp.]|uniref:Calx-beta domain-containing protein n=1 Tax=Candidatus Poriferisodalis sp. TaxID=3101277 RepID=UPI003B52E6AE